MASDRFTSQASHAEDLLKSQTVGLVNLSDFRKRRAEAIEQSEREQDGLQSRTPSQPASGTATPVERSSTPQAQLKKRKAAKGKLSFAVDGDDVEDNAVFKKSKTKGKEHSTSSKPPNALGANTTVDGEEEEPFVPKRRLGPNTSVASVPKVMTKNALQKEATEREKLRKEFMVMQEQVKATEIMIPFVFHEGTNVPGGACKVKKGDPVWLFLDRCRKLGAELAVGGSSEAKNRRKWARVGIDDLMLVRGDIIIPHHYEFYYFIVNKTLGYDSSPLFPYSTKPPADAKDAPPPDAIPDNYNPLSRPGDKSKGDENLEGAGDDPNMTKVINRQWYERNKHIFPASTWEEFDPTKDYTVATRRDAQGNSYFFSQ